MCVRVQNCRHHPLVAPDQLPALRCETPSRVVGTAQYESQPCACDRRLLHCTHAQKHQYNTNDTFLCLATPSDAPLVLILPWRPLGPTLVPDSGGLRTTQGQAGKPPCATCCLLCSAQLRRRSYSWQHIHRSWQQQSDSAAERRAAESEQWPACS